MMLAYTPAQCGFNRARNPGRGIAKGLYFTYRHNVLPMGVYLTHLKDHRRIAVVVNPDSSEAEERPGSMNDNGPLHLLDGALPLLTKRGQFCASKLAIESQP